ncbi:MAG: dihydroorotate dehydrogenase B (NAD(+)), electron transfer subunit [Phycisphaerae bacterium]|nr:MAG: dihydroorotate dehydrogenase B (NAD(+)), electron transfer subunit [Phycisphaerae bacterium]
MSAHPNPTAFQLAPASVTSNQPICREHYRLTLRCHDFAEAKPGQFVQLSPESISPNAGGDSNARENDSANQGQGVSLNTPALPFLPRAFSIGGLRRDGANCEIDIIYRVVGVATQWMATLRPGQQVSVLGPLGQPFPIIDTKPRAFLIGGGVGVPPLLWLAKALTHAGIDTIAVIGSTTKELLPLNHQGNPDPASDAREAQLTSTEFANARTPVIISTDDGSFGFTGNVVQAFQAHLDSNNIGSADTVVYTCGPERMMQGVSELCAAKSFECYVCMERSMACGVGTCQSCVVTVQSEGERDWRYALCCTEGPIFESTNILWNQ